MRWFSPVVWPLLVAICSFLLVSTKNSHYIKIKGVEYFNDETGTLSLESIKKSPFHLTYGTIPPAGKSIWIKIELPEALNAWPVDTVLFTGSNEAVKSMNAYIVRNQSVEDLGYCDAIFSSASCLIPTLQYAFPIKRSETYQPATLYLKMAPGATGIHNEFYFMKSTYFNKVTIFLVYFVGASTGIFLIIALLSIIFYTSLKEISFLAYGLFYLNLFLSTLVNRGIWDAYRPDNVFLGGDRLLFPILALTIFFDLLFLYTFFDLPKKAKRLVPVYILFFIILAAIIILSFIPETKAFAWKAFSMSVSASMLLATGSLIYFLWQGRAWAEPVATAWGVAIVCNLIWNAYRSGNVEGFWFFGYYAIFGRVLEAMILNLVIFQKLKSLTMQVGFSDAKNEENAVVKTLLRTLSHDLSNATQLIKISAELIKGNKNPQANEKNIEYILNAAKSQAEIIEMAKGNYLVQGGQLINLMPVDLKLCINEVLELFAPRLNKKKLTVHLSISDEKFLIFAEKTSLCHQVLANLINNAIKFSHENKSIYITISKNDNGIEFKIRDEGIGISGHILDRLFDPSEQISRPGTQGEHGTGSGLAIVKDFISTYGATMTLDSMPGNGTEITIVFQKFN